MSPARAPRLLVSLVALAALHAGSGRAVAPQERAEMAALSDEVKTALAEGKVVLLEGKLGDRSISTKIVAVLPVAPSEVVDEIRDYAEMGRLVPGLRSLTVARGDDHDSFTLQVKPHALLPVMELSKEVTVASQDDGDVTVDVELVRSSYQRIEGQSAEWQLIKLGESATLAIYQTHDRYRSLPFRQRVYDQVTDGCQRLVDDVRVRCTQRAQARLLLTADEVGGGF